MESMVHWLWKIMGSAMALNLNHSGALASCSTHRTLARADDLQP